MFCLMIRTPPTSTRTTTIFPTTTLFRSGSTPHCQVSTLSDRVDCVSVPLAAHEAANPGERAVHDVLVRGPRRVVALHVLAFDVLREDRLGVEDVGVLLATEVVEGRVVLERDALERHVIHAGLDQALVGPTGVGVVDRKSTSLTSSH